MSEMSDWINRLQVQGAFTRPPNENVTYGDPVTNVGDVIAEKPAVGGSGMASPGGDPAFQELYGAAPPQPAFSPDLPAGYGAPPWAGDPNVPAPLAEFLRQYSSGYSSGLTPEMYNYFNGDGMIAALQKFDPNARWVDTDIGGGEGGTSTQGRRLEYNQGMLPQGAGPGWMSPVSLNSDRLRDPRMQYYDPNYGWVTDPRNAYHKSEGIEKWAPAIAAAIGMGGPAIGAALAAGGIGAGLGGTAAVTGAAAGLPAANIAMGGVPTWWSQWLAKAPRTVGPILSGAPSVPSTNPRPPITKQQAAPDAYGFDPSAFNAGGSSTKPTNNDSSLVATRFADDPYGFSKGY